MFQVLGILLAGTGIIWLCEVRGVIQLPGQVAVDRLRARAIREVAARNFAGAEADTTLALAWSPMEWDLYSLRAEARLYLGRDRDLVADDFRRARYLEPFIAELPQKEAQLWALAGERTLAVSALGEACRREPGETGTSLMLAMFMAGRDQGFLDELARYSRRNPGLLVAFLRRSDTPQTAGYLAAALTDDPTLDRLDDAQKAAFLEVWAERGDAAKLVAACARNPAWQKAGWRWWAAAVARTGEFEQACALAVRWTPRPAMPPPSVGRVSLSGAANRSRLVVLDPLSALQNYRAAKAAGDGPGTLAALQEVTAQAGCPPYFYYLEALAYGEASDWRSSWEAWSHYFNAAHIQD